MDTPVCDFVKKYTDSGVMRLHMPGHKGKSFIGAESLDITEVEGADVLYNAKGIIKQSEQNAAELFGTAKTLYSAAGSSLSIRAMLLLAMLYAKHVGRRPLITAGRNAHSTFITSAMLLDFEIDWLYGDSLLSCDIDAVTLERHITENNPAAVYVTSPDYLGNTADIATLARVCRKHGVILLVDNAHGAYLRFLEKNRHPIALGADICCDSAHKTLPVLTGGGYLHLSSSLPEFIRDRAESVMSMFASTSPSYLVIQSLDAANKYLAEGYREKLSDFVLKIRMFKEKLTDAGYIFIGDEPLKITVDAKAYGYTGNELCDILADNNIVCEFCDPDHLVLMLTPENGEKALNELCRVMLSIPQKAAVTKKPPRPCPAKVAMTPKETLLYDVETLPLDKCPGRVLATPAVSCPPAVPVLVCGEIIDQNAIEIFKYYGTETCTVIK